LLDTLAHCYTPHCTPRPSPYIYKRKVQSSRTRRWSRGRTDWRTVSLSLSPSRTLVTPYCKRIRPGRRTTRRPRFPLAVFPPLCSVSRRPIWAGTRSDNLLVGPGTPGVETPTHLMRRQMSDKGSRRRFGRAPWTVHEDAIIHLPNPSHSSFLVPHLPDGPRLRLDGPRVYSDGPYFPFGRSVV
jgi:hypothetical protein